MSDTRALISKPDPRVVEALRTSPCEGAREHDTCFPHLRHHGRGTSRKEAMKQRGQQL